LEKVFEPFPIERLTPQYVFHWSLYLEVRNKRLLKVFITKCHNQIKCLVLCQSLNLTEYITLTQNHFHEAQSGKI